MGTAQNLPSGPNQGSPLRDVDGADRAYFIQAATGATSWCILLATIVAVYLRTTRGTGLGWLALLFLGAIVLGMGIGRVAVWVGTMAGRGFAGMVTGAGNLTPAPSFSFQESLIARGRYQEAADSFLAHLALHPADQDARLALADLMAGPLGDPPGAARTYLDIRARGGPAFEFRVSQALIDLYRATGNRGRLLAELARFADRHRGTAAGGAARRDLLLLKEEAPDE